MRLDDLPAVVVLIKVLVSSYLRNDIKFNSSPQFIYNDVLSRAEGSVQNLRLGLVGMLQWTVDDPMGPLGRYK